MKGHRFAERLGFAWAGLRAAWRMEKSLRIHALACVGVVLVIWLYHSLKVRTRRLAVE